MIDAITIYAVGDISLGDDDLCLGYGVRSAFKRKNNFNPFKKVYNIFSHADFVFGNLEVTLSEKGLTKKNIDSAQMRSFPGAANCLVESNFNILNLANNHSLQHGAEAFIDTVDILKRLNISPIGLRGDNGYTAKPEIMMANGVKIGFLGYAFEEDVYYKDKTLYAFYESKEKIIRDVADLKKSVDIVIISCHWGLELMDRPSVANIRLAHDIIDSGANIILGHHPHVLQGIEKYNNGLICYSLGNFVFDMLYSRRFRQSIIVEISLSEGGIEYDVIPVWIDDDYMVKVAEGRLGKDILGYMRLLNEKLNKEIIGDTEKKALAYYLEFENLRKRERFNRYTYFLKNINKYDRNLFPSLAKSLLKKAPGTAFNVILAKTGILQS
jgi:Bacterial capsule synthesis protein PGA_cap